MNRVLFCFPSASAADSELDLRVIDEGVQKLDSIVLTVENALSFGAGDDACDSFMFGFGNDVEVNDVGLNSLEGLFGRIKDYVQSQGSAATIKNIILFGHGVLVPGTYVDQQLVNPGLDTGGNNWGTTGRIQNCYVIPGEPLSPAAQQFFTQLKTLRSSFSWTIELYGCNTGAGSHAAIFLQHIADLTGATVFGYDCLVPIGARYSVSESHRVYKYPSP